LGIPGGLLAVILGTALAWISTLFGSDILNASALGPAVAEIGLRPPDSSIGSILEVLRNPAAWGYFSVIFPMGLFNVVGSLQNIESAEAEGDSYSATSSLAVNGIGTLVGAAFGSCFPTTIYIGHPGWKRLGARAGYSIYNAIFIGLVCFAGFMPLVLATVPLEAGVGVVLWIGIIITAQAFQATPGDHAPAVAIGLFPAVAAWGLLMVDTSLALANLKVEDMVSAYEGAGTRILGMIHLSQGFILTCMIWSAAAVAIVEREFGTAAVWMGAAAVLSCLGLIHAFQFQGGFVANKFGWMAAPEFAAAYLLLAIVFFLFGRIGRVPEERGVETPR